MSHKLYRHPDNSELGQLADKHLLYNLRFFDLSSEDLLHTKKKQTYKNYDRCKIETMTLQLHGQMLTTLII